ncbi:MAG TPA: GNAT family N-acetyltransferase [Polyangia bacterium]|nr:GNAT family N-acetyltransferase [Polyangia bacterium]
MTVRRTFFDAWSPALDLDVARLPETELCTRELLREICATPGPKRIGVARDADGPVAIVPFLVGSRRWEPLLQWILPGTLGLARGDGDVFAAFPRAATSHVGWWRQSTPPPASPFVFNVKHDRAYGMALADDPVPHWKTTSQWQHVKAARNRCVGFQMRVNAPGMAEWTIRSWEAHWRTTTDAHYPDLPYRVVGALDLERRGRHFTLTLHDGDKPVAGHTFVRHGDAVVWQLSHRDPDYDKQNVATRLLDMAFDWARDLGVPIMDLGALHAYKARWAPELRDRYEFDYAHPALRALDAGARRARAIAGALKRRLGGRR